MKIPIFPRKYHQNGGFSWAMSGGYVSSREVVTCQFCEFFWDHAAPSNQRSTQTIPSCETHHHLVGGFNPFEKYARQIGSFPQGSG